MRRLVRGIAAAVAVVGTPGFLLVVPSVSRTPAAAALPVLPAQMRHLPANQTQLITVEVSAWGKRDGLLSMWGKRPSGEWVRYGYAAARLGSHGMVPGQNRMQDTFTTPSGRYTVPLAFGRVTSSGYHVPYRLMTTKSYWCLDNLSSYYNRWVEQKPMTVCRASESEHLLDFREYRRAVQIGFNLGQVRNRGGGIFIHDTGTGYTAGCVAISPAAMDKLSLWLRATSHPTIVLGTRTSIINQT